MSSQKKAEIESAASKARVTTVTLDEPIERGDEKIHMTRLTEPRGGALRGLSLSKLMNDAETDEHIKLIERISEPKIFKADFDAGKVALSDLMQLVSAVTLFFVPKAQREKIEEARLVH